jgi:hypothetical protein
MGETIKIVVFKLRRYRLIWLGDTRYGRRAHLEFLSKRHPKRFWVDAKCVTAAPELAERATWETAG